MHKLLAVLCAAVSLPVLVIAADEPVPVYLATGGSANGFTDPNKDRADSTKDLIEALASKKNIRLVKSKDDSVILLEVLNRKVREDSGTMTRLMGGKHEVKMLNVVMSVGDFQSEMSAESAGGGMSLSFHGAWKKAAYKIAGQVEKWIDQNRVQLATMTPGGRSKAVAEPVDANEPAVSAPTEESPVDAKQPAAVPAP